MAEFKGCNTCKHVNKSASEYPCYVCKHNAIDKYEPQTNASRIRAMTDKELAEWISRHDTISQSQGYLTVEELLRWLRKEVDE